MEDISRRHFIASATTAGLALWLGLTSEGNLYKALDLASVNFSPFILIEASGQITLFNTKPEIGQGTFQSFPALIAEELEVSLDEVTIKQTNGEYQFGNAQRSGGSASIRNSYLPMRKIGAAAREVLIKAAAKTWNVLESECFAQRGSIIHALTERKLSYGALIQEAAKLDLPENPKLKDPKYFKILGKMSKRPDIPLKTNGSAEFGIDAIVPGMLYAVVYRSPVIGGTLKSFDATEVMKIPGVVKVGTAERIVGVYNYTGVAIIATSYWIANKAKEKLITHWDNNGFDKFNTLDYEAHLRVLAKQAGIVEKSVGNVDDVNLPPNGYLEAFYETPIIAHHALEPLNCTAQVKKDKVEIWTSTQVSSAVTGKGAGDMHVQIGFAPENITLHSLFVGGGFGRRLSMDYIVEAVNVAKLVEQPVKVIWSREDCTQHGPFRPMTFSKLKGGLSAEGKLISFEHKVISPSLQQSRDNSFDPSKVDLAMMEGISEQAYEIPNMRNSYVRADLHIPVSPWRSVTSSTVSFAQESFIDELAYKAKKDPMDFRLELLQKPSDAKKVLLKLKELSQWYTKLPKGSGKGVAVWEFFAGLGGQVVEVTCHKDKTITIDRVIAVIDLGEVVNPDNVINQMEGSVIMGLGAVTKGGINFVNGKVAEHNFYDSPLLRVNEIPKIEVHILTDGGKVKGVGEPGLPPFAPALANAIFAASGKRFRKLPFKLIL
ncbi:xanthine dehydrogenase family protein molybdopterin-binding subunit [Pedobacter sp. ISL-68]|uniref:xanthine dehydrogenase family protein molybdopterin-binding subunit n=1 Tax=unclassified Pedobacter TaxID=2628915 RepID=UPI001BEB9B43|nr:MULTISPECIES: molybdopterin cofactor-binding domain-containing protein [unclassified Pedobacter]MBT2560222.1 xanthine dehydrogenase family protein molybdopterin-binding subunit [Pedobacter sp. ISL-64]MBT2589202.1 xanthine dehydrogenase family protein molybdopterin-binding subunit [Pedobacter sp. ISL-68]